MRDLGGVGGRTRGGRLIRSCSGILFFDASCPPLPPSFVAGEDCSHGLSWVDGPIWHPARHRYILTEMQEI
jgi:hypothetical protein